MSAMRKSFMDKWLAGLEKDEFIRTRLSGKRVCGPAPMKKGTIPISCFQTRTAVLPGR